MVSSQENGDERKAIDEIMTKLRTLVAETGITLFLVSHSSVGLAQHTRTVGESACRTCVVHRSIAQLSDIVIGMERNQQHEDEDVRNTTCVRVLKNRYAGETGPACWLRYDKFTGRIHECANPEPTGDRVLNLVFCDIETDGLDATTICVQLCRHNGESEVICNEKDFKDYVQRKEKATFVFHNGIGFDVPVVERLWDFTFDRALVTDTLILSRLADPSRSGGHSLTETGGNILGFAKGDHDDWSCCTTEMIDYCIRDVEVTEAVYKRLMVELDGFSQE